MAIDFNCNNDFVLEDDFVLLRPLQKEDIQYLLPFALEEPFLWTYSLKNPAGEEGMKQYIADALKARKEGKEYPFIVGDKRRKQYAGSTRFYDIQLQNQTLQLGYTWYGKIFQGTGLNKHCKYLLLSFAFEKLSMERVEFRADANNERSIAAMKSIGCIAEGILRSNMPIYDGKRRNSIILSILKDEWFSGVKERLRGKLR
ncbi:MAG: GNAT family N-acetyltransferase [Bacteroidota bacterium]|nr:GNAT family N-acetyltransferase [Bacteroidota bacterium]